MYDALLFSTLFIGFVPLILLFYKKLAFHFSYPTLPFIWLTAIATIYEYVGTYLMRIGSAYWFHIYTLLSFLAIYYFFYQELKTEKKKLLVVFFAFGIISYAIITYFWMINNQFVENILNTIFRTFFVIVLAFFWLKKEYKLLYKTSIFNETSSISLLNSAKFYFLSGIIIYYCTTFFLFLSRNYIYINSSFLQDFWMVNVLATLILRISLIASVWKMKKV